MTLADLLDLHARLLNRAGADSAAARVVVAVCAADFPELPDLADVARRLKRALAENAGLE